MARPKSVSAPGNIERWKAEVLEHVADGGSVRAWCRGDPKRPKKTTVYFWCIEDSDFDEKLDRAHVIGARDKFEEALEVARETMMGETTRDGPDGTTVTTEDMLGHRKLLVETLMRQAACYSPARFGLRVQNQHSGRIGFVELVEKSLQADDAPEAAE